MFGININLNGKIEEKCKTCRFNIKGECRVGPPIETNWRGKGRWARVKKDGWCDKWEGKE